jgi:uncharacterized protein (TIGR01777 family)
MSWTSETIAITGASGLIGRALTVALRARGARVVRIGRGEEADVQWNVEAGVLPVSAFDGVTGVVHLAGAPIAERWTAAHKLALRESRVAGTALLSRTLLARAERPRVLISGSATGIYGDRGNEVLTERSAPGTGFLADLCRAWEGATTGVEEAGVRVVHLRTGIVLSPAGGALQKMLPPFKLGVGGPMGPGTQYMGWIGLHDQVELILWALQQAAVRGPLNAVAPNPVTNAEFAAELGRVLSRPALLPVPAFALRLAFGEMAEATMLTSQRAVPEAALAAGFPFAEEGLAGALRRELGLGRR